MKTHLLKCPSGKFTFVGSVPATLCDVLPATTADIMGQRWYKNDQGDAVCAKPKVFDTEAEAREYAKTKNVELI